MPDEDQELKELLRQVYRLELRTERWVDSLSAGQYRSRFKGQGMEFEEVREYAEGDDVRHLDWNVTARAGRPYIKTFREERDLAIMLLVDVSGSMKYGAIPGLSERTKMVTAAQAAAIIGVTAMRNNDLLGLVTFSNHCEEHLRPRKGRQHCMRVIRECLASAPGYRATALSHAIEEFVRATPKRTVCFIISDFLQYDADLGTMLARAARRHDVLGLRIGDPSEWQLPAGSAPLVLADPESDAEAVLAGGRRARARYAATVKQVREETERLFGNAGCQLIDINTAESAFAAIRRCFERRRRRRG